MSTADNPFRPPTDTLEPTTTRRSLRVSCHCRRNVVMWSFCLTVYCVIDYFYVHFGPATVAWFELLGLPLFVVATIAANRGLFTGLNNVFLRWGAICAVSFLISIIGGFVLILFGLRFHLWIGGKL